MIEDQNIKVVIVGAGVDGLVMAAQLIRFGVCPVIIDRKLGPSESTGTLLLNPRTLEVFRQLDLIDAVQEISYPIRKTKIYRSIKPDFSGEAAIIDWHAQLRSETFYPYFLLTEKHALQKLLMDRLTEHLCSIVWDANLEGLYQMERSVHLALQIKGRQERWVAEWIVGADGAQSKVRRELGMSFSSKPALKKKLIVEGRFEANADLTPFRNNHLLFHSERGSYSFFPDLRQRRFHVFAENANENELRDLLSEFEGIEEEVSMAKVPPRTQTSTEFGSRNSFLIGQAAHAMTDPNSESFNLSTQESSNLSWKLAAVIDGKCGSHLLRSYPQERALAMASAQPSRFKRFLDRLRKSQKLNLTYHTQRHPTYRGSALSLHYSGTETIRAGDRFPWMELFDEKQKVYIDTHSWCLNAGFVLLILGTVSQHMLHVLGQWIKHKYPSHMYLYYLPYSVKNDDVFVQFDLSPTQHQMLLIRPDMHIAYTSQAINTGLIDTYMTEILDWKG